MFFGWRDFGFIIESEMGEIYFYFKEFNYDIGIKIFLYWFNGV